jgi:hypothetical protein
MSFLLTSGAEGHERRSVISRAQGTRSLPACRVSWADFAGACIWLAFGQCRLQYP